jgi:hypothetical protein
MKGKYECNFYLETNGYCGLCPYANHVKCVGTDKCAIHLM